VSPGTTDSDKGGTIIGKYGKSYQAKKKEPDETVQKPTEQVTQRSALDILKDISKLYLELPRDPSDAVVEMSEGGECLSAGRAEHMAWWLTTYAKIVKDYTEEEDIVINVPDEVAQ